MLRTSRRRGFTMIELLVVIAVTALLSGIAIVYSHVGQNQVALSVEASKVAELTLQAKELSIATYSQKQSTCGYGVMFAYNGATSTYSLFEYDIPASSPVKTCPSLASTTASGYITGANHLVADKYTDGSWDISPAEGVKLVDGGIASGTIKYVLFYPPDPFTLVSLDGQTFVDSYTDPNLAGGNIYLQTVDGSASRAISVSLAGQVNL